MAIPASTNPAPAIGGAPAPESDARIIALVGNPNTGKTTLFNRISGLNHKTSNFAGTTLEARIARVRAGIEGGRDGDLIDLPGVYSIELDALESRIVRDVLAGQLAPRGHAIGVPEVCVIVVDATNLARNLMMVGEVIRRRLPTLVVVNMIDLAQRQGLTIDAHKLSEALGCGVVMTNARTGEGIDQVRMGIREARIPTPVRPVPGEGPKAAAAGSVLGGGAAGGSTALRVWAEEVFALAAAENVGRCKKCGYDVSTLADRKGKCPECGAPYARTDTSASEATTDKIDRVLMHPVLGVLVFAAVMTGLFWSLFSLAAYPMDWIDGIFGWTTGTLHEVLPKDSILVDLLTDGVIAGVGATVIFLPQICLLFFLISLLEDTGYLARAALLMDRVLRPFGLPGHAFVPLLSSHACALPGIMATRAIPDRKERLATILVAPFVTCSARLPVYVLLTGLLFAGQPAMAALAFVGCYALGIAAAVFSALIARRTILRGKGRPMVMELPSYKLPSIRTALITTYHRGWVFLKNAGTNILMICIALWWLSSYPKVEPPAEVAKIQASATSLDAHYSGDPENPYPDIPADELVKFAPGGGISPFSAPDELREKADHIEARHQAANSFAGRLGKFIQPVFEPLGYDWQLSIGVLSSFAAREVFVSTMAVVVAGSDDAEDAGVLQQVATAKRDDGVTPVFTRATAWSLLIYYVLAMQCLPTLAVTARESGSWKWAGLQLVWMCGIAYLAAMVVFQVLA
ncbi:MAG: ferrous iron transport protein B [Phycisphaeraceae bacterium]|nr:ferrous iron transport protein B [Phycisphaeraceae bacterium]